ncbi:TPA: hypothetical protein DCX15_02240, partial [bacterium]|nr:hypothetical protein [bacterium]
MKLEEIYIDGFGIFHNYHLKVLSPTLTIFAGPNEAGKSTLLSFLKRILFGFPDKRNKANPYPPLAGGSHGGRLVVSTDRNNDRYIIQRYSRQTSGVEVIMPDGIIGATSELMNLVGDVNRDIFESVYAFGLSELQDFETLNNEAVKDRLYSAGTGLGNISLSEIRKDLEREAGELFKPGGAKPQINSLFKDLSEINTRLKEIENNTQKYDNLHQDLKEVITKIKSTEERRDEIRARLYHTKSLIRIWDDFRKMEEAKSHLQKIPMIKDFPEDGLEMLARNKERLEELNETIPEKKEILKEIKGQKSLIKIDQPLLDNKERILALLRGEERFIAAVNELEVLREKLRKDQERQKEALNQIGPTWNDQRLTNFDISLPTKEMVRKRRDTMKEMEERLQDFQKEVDRAEEDIKDIEGKIEEIEERLKELSCEMNREALKEARESLRNLRLKYPDLKEKEAQIQGLPTGPSRPFLRPEPIAGGIFSSILFVLNEWIWGVVILELSLVLLLILVRRSQTILKKRREFERELQRMKDELFFDLEKCGFEAIPEFHLIEDKDMELEKAGEKLLRFEELNRQRDLHHQDLNKFRDKVDILKEKLEGFKKVSELAHDEWREWLLSNGLEPQLSPEGVLEIFTAIRSCLERRSIIEEERRQIESTEGFINEYRDKVVSLLRDCQREKDEIDAVVELEKISQDLISAEEEQKTLKELERIECNLESELEGLKEKYKTYEEVFSNLLSSGSAQNEAEFKKNAQDYKERKRLISEILGLEEDIKRVSGERAYNRFITELKEATPEILKEEESRLEERLKKFEEELSKLSKDWGGIAKEIEQIERSEENASLQIQQSVLTQQLAVKAQEWSILVLARGILQEAIERYEREKQPGVIKEAQLFFSKMTLGRYSRIYAPLGETKIYAEDRDGRRKDVQELSRGTAEQLYLSLRFGFIREFNKRTEPLPVILDDILVNFDPERFKATCEAIKELSRTNQVFYFTCHPQTIPPLA